MLVLVIAALTQWVFPIAYEGVTAQLPGPSLVLVARNVLLVALVVVVVRDLVRTATATSATRVTAAAA